MSIIESVKTAADLAVKLHDGDLKVALQKSLLDAQGEALALQQQLFDMQGEIRRLADEIQKRDDNSEIAEQLFFDRNAYWRKDETIQSAYCSACWDAKRQLVRLSMIQRDADCKNCKARFRDVQLGAQRPPTPS